MLLSDFEHLQNNKNSGYHLHTNYIIRLTHIFVACNSHKHHDIPITIAKLKDALQRIWTALLQKSIAKGVKDFPEG